MEATENQTTLNSHNNTPCANLEEPPTYVYGGRNQSYRNWAKLPDDVTASILSRLGTLEILRTAQRVCMTWRRICQEDSLVWKAISIQNENCIDASVLDKICRRVIDLSSGNLVDISVEFIGTDQLLKYMAESSSGIRRLRLVNCTKLTNEGFSEVASKLPLLEDLDISRCDNISSSSLKVATCSFPLLKSCKLNSIRLNISSENKWIMVMDK